MYNHQEYIKLNSQPTPRFKVGDWIENTGTYKGIFQAEADWIKESPGGNTCKTGKPEDFKLWKPTVGELAVFSDNGKVPYYIVAEFNGYTNLTLRPADRLGVYWDKVLPLEFLQTLKR